jgi:excisionase family DNA binding protein
VRFPPDIIGPTNSPRDSRRVPCEVRPFITLDEAAGELGCTRRFIEKRIEEHDIRVFKPSANLVRISRVEWRRWIESYSYGGKDTN